MLSFLSTLNDKFTVSLSQKPYLNIIELAGFLPLPSYPDTDTLYSTKHCNNNISERLIVLQRIKTNELAVMGLYSRCVGVQVIRGVIRTRDCD